MKKIIIPIIVIIVIAAVFVFWPKKAMGPVKNSSETTAENQNANKAAKEPVPSDTNIITEKQNMNLKFPGVLEDKKIKNKKVVMTTSKGVIEFDLDANQAPKAASNFVYLSENKFYDNLTFHRVEPGFVIQGGDPEGTGMGGPGYQFADDTVTGEYKGGTVAMANAGTNTNGSQFFICLDDQPSLPKNYSIFGQVTKGMDVVSKIAVGDKIQSVTVENK